MHNTVTTVQLDQSSVGMSACCRHKCLQISDNTSDDVMHNRHNYLVNSCCVPINCITNKR